MDNEKNDDLIHLEWHEPGEEELTADDIVLWRRANPRLIEKSSVVLFMENELRRMLLDEEGWKYPVSDPLTEPFEMVGDEWLLLIKFPDGRMYVADLCTPIHDNLKEKYGNRIP